MKKAILFSVASMALAVPLTVQAQTVINNNITVQNGGGHGGGRGDRNPGTAVNWRNNQRQLEAWMYTDRTEYVAGSGVRIRLTLTNLLDRQMSTTLQPRGEYEIVIRDVRTRKVVWSRTRTQNRNGTLRLDAQSTAQWNEIWDQRDNAGNPVPSGTYQIESNVLGLPLSVQIFLSDRGNGGGGGRPNPGNGNGNGGGLIPADPVTGPSLPGNGNDNGQQPNYQSVRGTLSLSRPTAQAGDALRFTYIVTNTGRSPVTLNFRTTQMFDAWATPVTRTPAATRTPVWRFSEGMVWGQAFTSLTLNPGQSRTFTASWRVPAQLTAGQTLDFSAALTPNGMPSGSIGASSTRLSIN